MRLLRNVKSNDSAKFALEVESDLRQLLENANFNVSLAGTTSIIYGEMLDSLNTLQPEDSLGTELVIRINREAITLENIVFAEALTKKIYILPSRRFNTEFLLNNPERLLREGAFDKLNEIARTDMSSACKCILFGEATAAAFHILRATESVLKSYYHHHRKQNRIEKPMWAGMLEQLKAKSRNRPSSSLLAQLDLIRTAYRNPTQHPEALYQIDSAQDLFGVCLDVIGKMTDEL